MGAQIRADDSLISRISPKYSISVFWCVDVYSFYIYYLVFHCRILMICSNSNGSILINLSAAIYDVDNR